MYGSRDRVLQAIQHQNTDRIPVSFRLSPGLQKQFDLIAAHEDVKPDINYVMFNYKDFTDELVDNEPVIKAIELEQARRTIQLLQQDGYAVATRYLSGIYEVIKRRIGVERALTDMYDDPGGLMTIIETVTEGKCKLLRQLGVIRPDIYWIGDDLGTQNSLIMSLDQYRQFYLPGHRKIIDAIRRVHPEAIIAFHCCGHIMPIVPDLINIGINLIESVQPEANNDLFILKKQYGKDIGFWGAVGLQSTFLCNDPVAFTRGIKSTLDIMGQNGGYVCAPCHQIDDDVPLERVIQFIKTVQQYPAQRLSTRSLQVVPSSHSTRNTLS
jgi:uroporphyrinogen decarboxylase